ncbi:hypothetical protein E2C01_015188 [Portunus trituberculatus]|uniref:Uncharacterized protein n=1 Tax=Portunus trituberculatus TaxID=210409 RepID=A0A5B7DL07_PORTR|nr:hypothetical protein [Portunus trituberculatus]
MTQCPPVPRFKTNPPLPLISGRGFRTISLVTIHENQLASHHLITVASDTSDDEKDKRLTPLVLGHIFTLSFEDD